MLIANVLLIKNVSAQHACAKHKIEQHALLFAQEKMPSAMDDYDINYHKLELEVSNTSTYLRNKGDNQSDLRCSFTYNVSSRVVQ